MGEMGEMISRKTLRMQVEQGTSNRPKPFQAHLGSGRPGKSPGKSQRATQSQNRSSGGGYGSFSGTRAGHEKTSKPLREFTKTTPVFSWYWWLWRSSEWEVFLDGRSDRTFKGASSSRVSSLSTKGLESRPGVYEFCLMHPNSKKHFKVYAGMSGNVHKRHHSNYRVHGSHLLPQFERSLSQGYVVLRRVTYCKTKEKAKELESRLLASYDYPWNYMENGKKRHVSLVQDTCCCCFSLPVRVERQALYAC